LVRVPLEHGNELLQYLLRGHARCDLRRRRHELRLDLADGGCNGLDRAGIDRIAQQGALRTIKFARQLVPVLALRAATRSR
jgi:hypothetical protein